MRGGQKHVFKSGSMLRNLSKMSKGKKEIVTGKVFGLLSRRIKT